MHYAQCDQTRSSLGQRRHRFIVHGAVMIASSDQHAAKLVSVSGIIPTSDRAPVFRSTLESLGAQLIQPAELIVIDASTDLATKAVCESDVRGLRSKIRWFKADNRGAATQRNQGVGAAAQSVIWFIDDDILLQPECVGALWAALTGDNRLGGVSAMIVNQAYHTPGPASRVMFTLMNGKPETSFAGKIIGPAINLLPEDRDDLPEVVSVEWLNTTCTMYRREALPDPLFDSFFTGYSLFEDLALSSQVRQRGWKLANARKARIFHDSQAASYKSDISSRSAMETANRHHVMTRILHREGLMDYAKLLIWECFQLTVLTFGSNTRRDLWPTLRGKMQAVRRIFRND